jgi:hypothetical protein
MNGDLWRSSGCAAKGNGGRYTEFGGGTIVVDCGVTGLVTDGGGAEVEATLFGGLGRDGKKVCSGVEAATVAPFAGVGDPEKKSKREKNKINLFHFNSHDTIWRVVINMDVTLGYWKNTQTHTRATASERHWVR